MPEGYTVTPQPVAGQHGPAWIRWLDRYAQEPAAAVAQIAVRDLPPLVREQITQEEDGEAATPQRRVGLCAAICARHTRRSGISDWRRRCCTTCATRCSRG